MKKLLFGLLAVGFTAQSFAMTDADCKRQALAAASAVRSVATGEIPAPIANQEAAKKRLVQIEQELSKGHYCNARQLATTQ